MTLGFCASVLSVSMAMSRSSSSRPMLWIVLGWDASFSGGGVTMAAVFNFLEGTSVGRLCCLLLDFDLAIWMKIMVGGVMLMVAVSLGENNF